MSANAVLIEIWSAMIAFLPIRYLHSLAKQKEIKCNTSNLSVFLRINLHNKPIYGTGFSYLIREHVQSPPLICIRGAICQKCIKENSKALMLQVLIFIALIF